MKCSLLTLSCALDGELSRERQSELEAHLVTCERCRTGMRYLRDETHRIAQLARVELSGATATALLERARVVVAPEPDAPQADAPRATGPTTDSKESAVDPFSLMGIGTQVVPVEVTPAGDLEPVDPMGPPSSATTPEGEPADLSPETTANEPQATDKLPASPELETDAPQALGQAPLSEPEAVVPTDPGDEVPEDWRPDVAGWADDGGAVPSEGSASGSRDVEMREGSDHPEDGGPDSADETQDSSPPGDASVASAEAGLTLGEPGFDPGWSPGVPGQPVPTGVSSGFAASSSLADPDVPAAVESVEPIDAAESWVGDDGAVEPGNPADPVAHPAQAGAVWPVQGSLTPELEPEGSRADLEKPWLAAGTATGGPAGVDSWDDPPPLFVPLRIESEGAPGSASPATSWSPSPESAGEEAPGSSPPPSSSERQSDEVMQVALEESALLGELSNLDRVPPEDAEAGAPQIAEPAIPPPPSITSRPDSRGWEPSTSLNLGLVDAATTPALDLIGTTPKPAVEIPPPLEDQSIPRTTTRPADSVAPLSGSSASGRLQTGRHGPVPPRSRRDPSKPAPAGAPPRSWTKTATIAVAALAVFLIGWSLLHRSSKPPPAPSTHHHAIAPTQSKPTPTQQPTAPTQPAVTLTSTQTFGGAGSGYQVQGVRYGLHQNNTQLWVVFQLVQGSGAPRVTAGFSGQTNLYLEMSGVAPGTAVAQPAPGGLITKVTPTQVPGFTGAAYLLQLSRASTLDSAYLLPGSETSSSGERVVLELQN